MENVATSVRISSAANATLSDLAARTGKPKAQIVEEALRAWEERRFWTEVQSAFGSGEESPELRAERELWDTTVGDGLIRTSAKRARAGKKASRPQKAAKQ